MICSANPLHPPRPISPKDTIVVVEKYRCEANLTYSLTGYASWGGLRIVPNETMGRNRAWRRYCGVLSTGRPSCTGFAPALLLFLTLNTLHISGMGDQAAEAAETALEEIKVAMRLLFEGPRKLDAGGPWGIVLAKCCRRACRSGPRLDGG